MRRHLDGIAAGIPTEGERAHAERKLAEAFARGLAAFKERQAEARNRKQKPASGKSA